MQPIYSVLKSLMIQRMLFPPLNVAAKDYILIAGVRRRPPRLLLPPANDLSWLMRHLRRDTFPIIRILK